MNVRTDRSIVRVDLRLYTQSHLITSLSFCLSLSLSLSLAGKLPLFRKYSIGVAVEEVKAAATAF